MRKLLNFCDPLFKMSSVLENSLFHLGNHSDQNQEQNHIPTTQKSQNNRLKLKSIYLGRGLKALGLNSKIPYQGSVTLQLSVFYKMGWFVLLSIFRAWMLLLTTIW